MDTITQRLHISGLTAAITTEDLQKRLGSFGSVSAVDGVGAINGVGLVKAFGYVTLQTTKPQLTKCMTLLNGSMWKGAKLKISEAKPLYAERLAVERGASPPPKKRRRLRKDQCVLAQDMSLVTLEKARELPNWTVTPMDRVVSHVKIRPPRPLPPQSSQKETQSIGKPRRKTDAPTRARRRVIDATQWDSTLLKGMWLENAGRIALPEPEVHDVVDVPEDEEDASSSENDSDSESPERPSSPPIIDVATISSKPDPSVVAVPTEDVANIAGERTTHLALLDSFFGDGEWMQEESVGSDIDEEALLNQRQPLLTDIDGDIEEVPLDEETPARTSQRDRTPNDTSQKTLKNLFASRETDAKFSLFDQLDVDLELDEDEFWNEQPSAAPVLAPQVEIPEPVAHRSVFSFNPTTPLFFPRMESNTSRRPLDPLGVAKQNGWAWSDGAFHRTDSSEDIRKKWEEVRQEVTAGWKKRAREAMKSGRKHGAEED